MGIWILKLVDIDEISLTSNRQCRVYLFEDRIISKKQYEFLEERINEYKPEVVEGYEIKSPELIFDDDSMILLIMITAIISVFPESKNFDTVTAKLECEIEGDFPKFYENLKQKAIWLKYNL